MTTMLFVMLLKKRTPNTMQKLESQRSKVKHINIIRLFDLLSKLFRKVKVLYTILSYLGVGGWDLGVRLLSSRLEVLPRLCKLLRLLLPQVSASNTALITTNKKTCCLFSCTNHNMLDRKLVTTDYVISILIFFIFFWFETY